MSQFPHQQNEDKSVAILKGVVEVKGCWAAMRYYCYYY